MESVPRSDSDGIALSSRNRDRSARSGRRLLPGQSSGPCSVCISRCAAAIGGKTPALSIAFPY